MKILGCGKKATLVIFTVTTYICFGDDIVPGTHYEETCKT